MVWKVPTERGFSSFVVADARAFTLVQREGAEVLVALDVDTGEELWASHLDHVTYDGGGDAGTDDNKGGDGPRSTGPRNASAARFIANTRRSQSAWKTGSPGSGSIGPKQVMPPRS
jgi:hypothetical protein